jgi:hypothetical protein
VQPSPIHLLKDMATKQWNPIPDYTQRDRVKVPSSASISTYGTEEVDALYDGDMERLINERQNTFHLQDIASAAAKSIIRKQSVPTLGKPTVKKRIYVLDMLVAVISLLCLALAFVAVSNEKVSCFSKPGLARLHSRITTQSSAINPLDRGLAFSGEQLLVSCWSFLLGSVLHTRLSQEARAP